MRANCTITLCDVETSQDLTTGDRTKNVVHVRKLVGESTNVGMTTFWSAASANVRLDRSVNVRSRMYQNQKYVLVDDGKLYEVVNVGKADDPSNARLNLKQIVDNELKELIADAVGLLQAP